MFKNKLCFTEKVIIFCIICCLIKILSDFNFISLPTSIFKGDADFGMDFNKFKARYYAETLANNAVQFSPYNAKIEENANGYVFMFPQNMVVMQVDINKRTNFVSRISVSTEPFKTKTKAATEILLINQSNAYALATMVFSPKMENQIWRENIIKQVFDKVNSDFVVSENLKCRALYVNETIMLIAEPK